MELSTSVALIAGLILFNTLFFVVAIFKLIKLLTEAQKFLEMARLQIVPISHDVTQILTDARSIVKSVEKQMGKVDESMTAIRDTTRDLRDFERVLQERLERPLLDITAILAGVAKGFKVFWQHFGKK